jgi:hypothetical protein
MLGPEGTPNMLVRLSVIFDSVIFTGKRVHQHLHLPSTSPSFKCTPWLAARVWPPRIGPLLGPA